jgi:16S rRNA (uracil1498-N3)-methyltransferase
MSSNNFDMPWFFEETLDINNLTRFEFNNENLHHCKNVLRVNKNSKILIFDGHGNTKTANISFNGKEVIFNNIEYSRYKNQKFNFSIVQSLCEINKLELVIQKVTELGCKKLFLTNSIYSKKFDLEFLEKKFPRWKKIMANACAQSKNPFLPEIIFSSHNEVCEKYQKNNEYKLICLDPHTEKFEFSSASKYVQKNIMIFIGPEGGYSNEEIMLFEKYNIEKININKYILRTETASMVGAFLAQILCNN